MIKPIPETIDNHNKLFNEMDNNDNVVDTDNNNNDDDDDDEMFLNDDDFKQFKRQQHLNHNNHNDYDGINHPQSMVNSSRKLTNDNIHIIFKRKLHQDHYPLQPTDFGMFVCLFGCC